jgi:hypothetical protein
MAINKEILYVISSIYPIGNGESAFYFCGDVGECSESKQRYKLLEGRDSN